MENKYLLNVYNNLKEKDKNEPEFLQAVYEVLSSIEPYVNEHPELEANGVLERFVEPERIITFRVPWVDDQGKVVAGLGEDLFPADDQLVALKGKEVPLHQQLVHGGFVGVDERSDVADQLLDRIDQLRQHQADKRRDDHQHEQQRSHHRQRARQLRPRDKPRKELVYELDDGQLQECQREAHEERRDRAEHVGDHGPDRLDVHQHCQHAHRRRRDDDVGNRLGTLLRGDQVFHYHPP